MKVATVQSAALGALPAGALPLDTLLKIAWAVEVGLRECASRRITWCQKYPFTYMPNRVKRGDVRDDMKAEVLDWVFYSMSTGNTHVITSSFLRAVLNY